MMLLASWGLFFSLCLVGTMLYHSVYCVVHVETSVWVRCCGAASREHPRFPNKTWKRLGPFGHMSQNVVSFLALSPANELIDHALSSFLNEEYVYNIRVCSSSRVDARSSMRNRWNGVFVDCFCFTPKHRNSLEHFALPSVSTWKTATLTLMPEHILIFFSNTCTSGGRAEVFWIA